jgi:demethylmenaquinone methyltransferase/2-methoxy-6-polyprenyl-1,4-benzoquinol methylase
VSRASQIRFLSHTAPFYDAVVRTLGFSGLWESVSACADPVAGTRCLDVCAGTGGVALVLAARGAQVLAVDLSKGMLERAQRKSRERGVTANLRLLQMDARRLAFPAASFPLVTCCMALHEMADDERATVLAEIRRVASDRVLVAEYRVPASRWGRAAFRIGRAFEFLESDDFASFLARPVSERLEEAGLRIEAVTNAGFYRIWSCRVEG